MCINSQFRELIESKKIFGTKKSPRYLGGPCFTSGLDGTRTRDPLRDVTGRF